MKTTYLILAVVGALVPYAFFLGFFADQGLMAFVPALFVNGAAAGFTADLLISSLVFWIYLFSRSEGPAPWPYVILNLTVGLSCALPAYLYAVTRRAEAAPATA